MAINIIVQPVGPRPSVCRSVVCFSMSVLDVGELEGETRRLEVCWVVSNVMKKLSTATDSLLYSPRIDFGPGLNWGAKGYLLTTDRKTHKDQSQHNSEAPERKLNGVEVYVGISVINCFARRPFVVACKLRAT